MVVHVHAYMFGHLRICVRSQSVLYMHVVHFPQEDQRQLSLASARSRSEVVLTPTHEVERVGGEPRIMRYMAQNNLRAVRNRLDEVAPEVLHMTY